MNPWWPRKPKPSKRHALWCEFWQASALMPTCTCGVFISPEERDRRTDQLMRERGLSL